MSITITEIENSLSAMGHGSTLKKVRNRYALYKRVAHTLLTKVDPIETIRVQQLSSAIHDDLQNYPLATDYKKLIDIAPVQDRQSSDRASRMYAEPFAATLNLRNKGISIEASEGVKFIRLNWKDSSAKTLNTMDSLTANGTWSAVGSAAGLKANSQYHLSGSASIEFDLVASGDGIQNTTMTAVDLTDEDEIADFIIPIYLGAVTNLTSISVRWGNDVTTNYWAGVAQTTQADGTAFRIGWNFITAPWPTATETGTVAPATTDSLRITFAATGAISNIRVDNILVSNGRFFDCKYYSQYVFKNSAGVWIPIPTSDNDSLVLSGTAEQIFILESLKAAAQQTEGKDSTFDLNYANNELVPLYQAYRSEFPSMSKRAVGSYSSTRPFRRSH